MALGCVGVIVVAARLRRAGLLIADCLFVCRGVVALRAVFIIPVRALVVVWLVLFGDALRDVIRGVVVRATVFVALLRVVIFFVSDVVRDTVVF